MSSMTFGGTLLDGRARVPVVAIGASPQSPCDLKTPSDASPPRARTRNIGTRDLASSASSLGSR